MTELGPFCAALQEAVCPVCPLRTLGEAALETAVQPGVSPREMGDALRAALEDLDGPNGEIAERDKFFADGSPYLEELADMVVGDFPGEVTPDDLRAADSTEQRHAALAQLIIDRIEPDVFRPAIPAVSEGQAAASRAFGEGRDACVDKKMSGACTNVLGLDELFAQATPRDLELGAATLHNLARHGTAQEVREMLARVRGVIIDLVAERDGVEVQASDIGDMDDADARERLMSIAEIVRTGLLTNPDD
ncbi:MAG TPA: hypothetical protein VLI54_06800 [Bacillota bacterium]|nr:hypothetical protein [Bacillota bacterium]